MAKSSGYIGWALGDGERERLLTCFPPAYGKVLAHHVTLAFGVPAGAPLPAARAGRIVGQADDGHGLQALVVEIDGSVRRPDGSTYHITWSIERGRRPAEANAVLQAQGWNPVGPVDVRLTPKFFPFGRAR